MAQPWEMDWGGNAAAPDAATTSAPPASNSVAPWEMKWDAAPSEAMSADAATPHQFGWQDTWPARMAKDLYSAVTLPGDVAAGRVDPTSDEAIGRSFKAATFFNPASAAMRGGESVFGVPLTQKPGVPLPENIQAATTAADLGAPLPVGLASGNKAVQAATKATQQLPFVGPKITEQAAKTVEAAGNRVGDISDELAGGVTDRASAGAILRPSLKGVIENNNQRIDEAFNDLRSMIDHGETAELPTTAKVLKQIVQEREAAGQINAKSGLEDISNLVDKGANFNGLQRARSDVGNSLNFGAANPGFNAGDLKRLYGAMTRDMEGVVAQTAKEGIEPGQAVQALRDANSTAAPIIESNKALQRLTGIQSDENLVGTLTKAAQDKTGNVRLLAQLKQSMPKEDFDHISGVALSELGHNASTGKFSLNQFATKWDKLGDRAKNVMFSPEHKAALDSIAGLGRHLKDADKFANTSNTAGAQAWAKLIASGAAAAGALTYGDVSLLLKGMGAAGGGLLIARQLAKPAAASAIAKWTRSAIVAEHGQTPARLAAFRLATRNLLNNFSSVSGRLYVSPRDQD